jgi:hypothetical protein
MTGLSSVVSGKDWYGKCGCNCGRCPGFAGNARTDADRQYCSDGWAKYLGARLNQSSIRCRGCQTLEPWKAGYLLPDRGCVIRPCAIESGAKTCANCSAFPCGAHGRDIDRAQVAERLGETIPEDDYLAFIEPYERVKHLEEIRAALAPEDTLVAPAAVKPIRARVARFPDDLALPKEEAMALAAVHKLIVDIQSARADTYACHLVRKRRRPHMLGLLWAAACYGDLVENERVQLVLDGTVHGERPEVNWFVRKRDNAFFGAVRQAARLLEDLGVRWEFVSLRDGWLFRISLDERAGGQPALEALKRYVSWLVEQHGDPTYARNSRYKGEAYARFARADMRGVGTASPGPRVLQGPGLAG